MLASVNEDSTFWQRKKKNLDLEKQVEMALCLYEVDHSEQ